MTRTTRTWSLLAPAGFMVLALGAVGCGPDAKDQKIEQLTAERDRLQGELDERNRNVNDALAREADATRTIEDLNQQLAALRAAKDKMADADGWVTMPGFDMISIPGSVLFDSGKADLKATGRSTLDKIASDIRARYSGRDIYIFGHTDDEPIRKSKWRDNWELGAHRALTVLRHLSGAGIPNEYLVQANCSQFRPRTPNAGNDGRRQNRRVEFYAVERRGGMIENRTAFGSEGN